tara:strand:- start:436 stop:669 length:234 start_codon:yes stop_codon:yes gene_type:complete
MIKTSDTWYVLGFKSKYKYPNDSWKKLRDKGIFSNARKSPSLNTRHFKTRVKAEKHLSSLPKERQKYYEVIERFYIL